MTAGSCSRRHKDQFSSFKQHGCTFTTTTASANLHVWQQLETSVRQPVRTLFLSRTPTRSARSSVSTASTPEGQCLIPAPCCHGNQGRERMGNKREIVRGHDPHHGPHRVRHSPPREIVFSIPAGRSAVGVPRWQPNEPAFTSALILVLLL